MAWLDIVTELSAEAAELEVEADDVEDDVDALPLERVRFEATKLPPLLDLPNILDDRMLGMGRLSLVLLVPKNALERLTSWPELAVASGHFRSHDMRGFPFALAREHDDNFDAIPRDFISP